MTELIVVSNRLPVHLASGRKEWERSSGGLAVALDRVLCEQGGTWVGWRGGRGTKPLPRNLGYGLVQVDLGVEEVRDYYDGLSNATLWPLYHDQIRTPIYRSDWWDAYEVVNQRFAGKVADTASEGALVWIHDYHLQLVPGILRKLRPDLRIGFFLHIPFPPPNLFARFPWRRDVIEGIAGADVIGFQTDRDADHFVRAARRVSAKERTGQRGRLKTQHIGAFPISADAMYWDDLGRRPRVEQRTNELRESFGNPEIVLLGIDRLDYSKGIEQRLQAFSDLLADGSLKVPNAVLVQLAVPSRDRTAAYRAERSRIEELVGRINGQYAQLGVAAVHYIHRSLKPVDVAALYRLADVMLVTPFHDGMNLVAKEFVATRVRNRGVLVLSEFAGAADELADAITINPHHPESLRDAIMQAISMPEAEVERRMRSMRRTVSRHTVHDWANAFLSRLQRDERT